jgi:YegS/Rv2252/BmrU family lipid kinase
MKLLLVANPISGRGDVAQRTEHLMHLLEERGHVVECVMAPRAEEAHARVRELEGKVDGIVVAGGDGTLNGVVNALADPSRTPLALLALGTANLVARELDLPWDIAALADLIASGSIRRLDLGRIEGRRFLTVVSSGFDAMVTRAVRRSRTGALGYSGYLLPILKTLFRYRPPHLEVKVDGSEPLTGALVLVCNTRSYGGLFRVADHARCDSGHLDVCVFRRARVRDLVRYAWAARRGRISRLAGVEYRTGRQIRIDSPEPVAVQVDGDYWGTTPVEIELQPGVVPILVPRQEAAHPSP